ncbi:hypothetical protein [Microbacterium sp. Bi128]|uniref:hypothetical protein n=1 Tax=Microbacterium sp. Bi128 TaxID=2821115 RepID=UPI001D91CD5E|nr:hypothetical protein [Microbacterium sp. Bi128]CAH0326503.1 hypothetical protein SRABI128_05377 [Microbacterium sp. Bi128]
MFSLGIEIGPQLAVRQAAWFAPTHQPFLIPKGGAETFGIAPLSEELPAELRDTFEIYNVPDELDCILIGEEEFNDLGRSARSDLVRSQICLARGAIPSVRSAPADVRTRVSTQADGHRFVWWPSLLEGHQEAVLGAYLRFGRRPSRHLEVPENVWDNARAILPGARTLAGTFPRASGPNCFGTVMAAAGRAEAADVWMLQKPFEDWLSAAAEVGGKDKDPGTVLVWRSPRGLAQHAAVTIGGGYALHKPSQGWMSPRKVLTVKEVVASARQPGRRLNRYVLTGSPGHRFQE